MSQTDNKMPALAYSKSKRTAQNTKAVLDIFFFKKPSKYIKCKIDNQLQMRHHNPHTDEYDHLHPFKYLLSTIYCARHCAKN